MFYPLICEYFVSSSEGGEGGTRPLKSTHSSGIENYSLAMASTFLMSSWGLVFRAFASLNIVVIVG